MKISKDIMNKKIVKSSIIICSISLIIYIILNIFIFKSYKNQTNTYINEINNNISTYIESDLINKVSNLEILSKNIQQHIGTNESEILKMCKQYIGEESYNDILISNENGKFKSLKTDKTINGFDQNYFKEAFNNKEYISMINKNDLNGYINQDIIAYSVPIEKENKIIGVLVGTNTIDEIGSKIDDIVDLGLYDIDIFSSNGNVLFLSNNLINLKDKYSKFDNLSLENLNINKEVLINHGMGDKFTALKIKEIDSFNKIYISTSIQMNTLFNGIYLLNITLFLITLAISVLLIRLNKTKIIKEENKDELINKLKYIDDKTSLLKYDKFIEEVSKTISDNKDKKYAIVNFDVESFKLINGVYGYNIGDCALMNIATNLNKQLKINEFASRPSNDLFIVFIEMENSYDELNTRIEDINKSVSKFNINRQNIKMNFSYGVYIIEDNINNSIAYVKKYIDYADVARIKSKGESSSMIYIYDDNLLKSRLEEMVIEKDVINGIKNNEFKLNYQAKVNTKNGNIEGAEALIRWYHPTLGFISSVSFIFLAEKTGDINALGRWILEQVCKDLQRLMKKGIDIVPISINLSRVELYQKDLIVNLDKIIKKYEINPKFIEIEITESTTLNDLEFIKSRIREIKSLGLSVSMDDFGTGNSNLSNLKELDIDVIKIDRSFSLDITDNKKSEQLVNLIIELSKNFGYKVVAEGIESKDQVEILKDMDCDLIQGYVFSRPVPIEEFENILIKGKFD